MIQGHLPRPAELEIYLESNGLYYRIVPSDGEKPEGAAEAAEGDTAVAVGQGTLLYAF